MSFLPSANIWYVPSCLTTHMSSTHDSWKIGFCGSRVQCVPSGEVAWPSDMVAGRSRSYPVYQRWNVPSSPTRMYPRSRILRSHVSAPVPVKTGFPAIGFQFTKLQGASWPRAA